MTNASGVRTALIAAVLRRRDGVVVGPAIKGDAPAIPREPLVVEVPTVPTRIHAQLKVEAP